MNTYTVVGAYPDAASEFACLRDGTFVETVAAPTPTVAARLARRRLAGPQGFEESEIAIIAVFEGAVADRYEPVLDSGEYESRIAAEDAAGEL